MNGDSSDLASKLSAHYQGFSEILPLAKSSIPKFESKGDYLEMGFSFPIPQETLNEFNYQKFSPIVDQIKGVDQRIGCDLEIGASLKDIISGEDPLLSQLNKGLKIKVNIDVVSQFRKVLLEIAKNPDL